jgi:hypothetical protein
MVWSVYSFYFFKFDFSPNFSIWFAVEFVFSFRKILNFEFLFDGPILAITGTTYQLDEDFALHQPPLHPLYHPQRNEISR